MHVVIDHYMQWNYCGLETGVSKITLLNSESPFRRRISSCTQIALVLGRTMNASKCVGQMGGCTCNIK